VIRDKTVLKKRKPGLRILGYCIILTVAAIVAFRLLVFIEEHLECSKTRNMTDGICKNVVKIRGALQEWMTVVQDAAAVEVIASFAYIVSFLISAVDRIVDKLE